jgi:hypothetical protein
MTPAARVTPRREDDQTAPAGSGITAKPQRSGAAAVLASAVAMTIDRVATVEWSVPYCNNPQDGPSSSAFGAPLPYERFGGVSSLEYAFAPHVYLLNIVLVSGLLFPPIRRALLSLGRRRGRLGSRVLTGAGVVLCLVNLAALYVALSAGLWRPVADIARPPHDSYMEFRPVGLALDRHYECTPSTFWFGAQRPAAQTPDPAASGLPPGR